MKSSIRPRGSTSRACASPSRLLCDATFALLLLLISAGSSSSSSACPPSIGMRGAMARSGPFGGVALGASNLLTSRGASSRRRTFRGRSVGVGGGGGRDATRTTTTTTSDERDPSGKERDWERRRPPLASAVRGGGGSGNAASSSAPVPPSSDRRLHFWEAMVCGAISRSAAQTIMHPANTMKTILQSSRKIPGRERLTISSFARWEHARTLTRGAGAQLVLSLPHGAVNFAVLELVRRRMNAIVSSSRHAESLRNFGPVFDFLSSAVSTVCCSVVSTPQMMICDNIMAGTYPNMVVATRCLMKERGISGFYTGWWPGIAGKIPSYGLTWTLFEQVKLARSKMFARPATDVENSIMGCIASATTVCIMIPMDTVKTRLVTQMNYPDLAPYAGINDCFRRVMREEGIGAFYRGLTPRLLSVVPMIGIQFGVYEFMKKFMTSRGADAIERGSVRRGGAASRAEMKLREEEAERERSSKGRLLQEMAMEVAADDDQPFPAPYPNAKDWWAKRQK